MFRYNTERHSLPEYRESCTMNVNYI